MDVTLHICPFADNAPRNCGLVNVWRSHDAAGKLVVVSVCTLCPDNARAVRRASSHSAAAVDAASRAVATQ